MKYGITHCYTDKNKGDAAIIISTVQIIRDLDPSAEIHMFSTYGAGDQRFDQEHELIKKHAHEIHPALFADPVPRFLGKKNWTRSISFIIEFIKYSMLLIGKNHKYIKLFLRREEINSVNAFLESDVIISKGGSYLSTENTSLRQTLSLIRLLYPFLLARRYKKKMFIFSQSLGPVQGKVNQIIFKASLTKVTKIYLRESLCLEKYETVRSLCDAVPSEVIPDSAFYLLSNENEDLDSVQIDESRFNVGFTVVNHDFKYIENKYIREIKAEKYKNCIIETIEFLVGKHDAIVRLFPQVIVNNSYLGHNDVGLAYEILNVFEGTEFEKNVFFHEGDWTPFQLRSMYSKMDIFVGTRLHSIIFALSCGVPSVNISYHGTKSQGILNQIEGMERFVIDIDDIDTNSLIEKIAYVIKNQEVLRKNLIGNINETRGRLMKAMESIVFG